MKKILIALVCLGIVGFVAVCFAETKIERYDKNGKLVESKTYNRWIECDDDLMGNVAISDNPVFSHGDIQVYESSYGGPVFVFNNKKTFCSPFQKDCGHTELGGFVEGKRNDKRWSKPLLFKITICAGSPESQTTYIDVNAKEVLYRVSKEGEPLVVSRKNPIASEHEAAYYGEQFSVTGPVSNKK